MERFRATTTWKVLRIESEPYLVMTDRGYALVVATRELSTDQEYELLITGIKALAEPLEQLRKANGNLFTGLQFGIRKESKDRLHQYQLDPKKVIKNTQNDGGLDQPLPKSQTHEERLWERITKRYKDDNSSVEHVSQGQRSEAADYIEVVFPDKNLEAAVLETLERPKGPLTREHLKRMKELELNVEVHYKAIENLTGLEHAVNLTTLTLNGNQISDVSPLESLTNLKWLGLEENQISDVSPLASLTNLNTLWLNGNPLDLNDIQALRHRGVKARIDD